MINTTKIECPECHSDEHMKQKAVLTYFRIDVNGTDAPMFCESDMSGARTNAFDEEEVALYFYNQELAGTCIVYECHNETCPNEGDEMVLRLGQESTGIYVEWVHQNPNYIY